MRWPRAQLGKRRTASWLTAAVAAFACLAGQVASLEHAAHEKHVVCREHGELEDVPSVAHVGEIRHAEAAFENGFAAGGGHGHDHCIFAAHARHSSVESTRRAWSAPAFAPSVTPRPLGAAAPEPLRSLYRLAPKTSPPV
jgi:hypothetical protein